MRKERTEGKYHYTNPITLFDFPSNKLYFHPQLWKLSGCELSQFPPPAGWKIVSQVTAFKGKATRASRNTNSSSPLSWSPWALSTQLSTRSSEAQPARQAGLLWSRFKFAG